MYTVESFREARRMLKPGGFLALSFCNLVAELNKKLYLMLKEVFDGVPPTVLLTGYDGAYTFIAGRSLSPPELAALGGIAVMNDSVSDPSIVTDASTDDWPYLYMPRRAYPLSYLVLWIPLLIVSVLFVRPLRTGAPMIWDGTAFFLGAAFMLLETKAFTEMALVWGATSSVTTAIIFAVLVLALISNELVIKHRAIPSGPAFGALIGFVFLGYLSTYVSLSALPWLAEALIRMVVLTLPIFFAGMCFSQRLRDDVSVARAMSSNLLGAMVGGLLEYTSMMSGFRALYLGVAVLYLSAYVASRAKLQAV